jgi:outer membrane protein assembly factor BamB
MVAAGVPGLSARAGTPSLALSRTVGPPTSLFFASGSGFQGSEVVDIDFDQTLLLALLADPNGEFVHSGPMHVPSSALPGPHTVTATGQSSGLVATSPFTVRTNWPRFHFDNANTGYNRFENVLSPLKVASLVQKWAVATAPGASPSPIVANGLVYVAPADGIVRALEPSSGDTVWATDTGGTMLNGFAPTLSSSGLLYVTNNSGEALALDAHTGKIVWAVHPADGASGDPLVANGLVYVNDALTQASEAGIALDAQTGATVLTMGFPLRDAPAVAFGIINTSYAFGGQVVGMSAVTGAILWDESLGGEIVDTGSPAENNGSVFAGVEGYLFAINDLSGKVIWSTNAHGFIDSAPAVANGVVYFASSGFIFASDARTGALLWKDAIPGNTGSSVAVANQVVYVGTQIGTLRAYDAATGNLLFESATGGASFTGSPVVADGVVYASADDGTVYAFGLP